MRKTIIMAALAVFSANAFAQDDVVKEAEKVAKKGNVAEAVTMITPALTSDQTTDKAKAWNVLFSIYHNQFNALFTKMQEEKVLSGNSTVNESEMYDYCYKAYETAVKGDEYDAMPNEKGKVKVKYRKATASKLANDRPNLINGGQVFYNNNDFATAIKYWKMYVDVVKTPLFSEIELPADPYVHEICYYIALASYNQKDYATAIEYAKLAAQDTAKVKDANEIIVFSMKDGAKTPEDSLNYLNTVKELHKKEPAEARYFNMLMEYYAKPGRESQMTAWCQEEIANNPNNKMAWALKGEVEMNTEKWDDAIASYKKAVEIDPDFVQVIFNIGVCINSKAVKVKDELADKNTGGLTQENADKVKALLEEAKVYLLQVKEKDPNRDTVNWVYPLYQIYYALGDETNAAEMEKLLKQ